MPCTRCIRYSTIIETTLNSSIDDRILRPAHLVVFVDASHPIEQALDGPQHRIQERAFSRLNTRVMKTPSGFVTAKISARKTRICNQPLAVISELLRAQQRVEQVHGDQRADDEHDERLNVHRILLLHAIAEMHVRDGRSEKRDGDGDPNNILHG